MSYGTNTVSSALTCVWCASWWVGAFFALFSIGRSKNLFAYFSELLALSAGAIFIEETLSKLNGDK